eukprot:m.2728 g.2728  ORF g.2728 m.2728 type:complete len:73 (+) comp1699_c0_seq1:218-436(+)
MHDGEPDSIFDVLRHDTDGPKKAEKGNLTSSKPSLKLQITKHQHKAAHKTQDTRKLTNQTHKIQCFFAALVF